jgi:hypothetical protein
MSKGMMIRKIRLRIGSNQTVSYALSGKITADRMNRTPKMKTGETRRPIFKGEILSSDITGRVGS